MASHRYSIRSRCPRSTVSAAANSASRSPAIARAIGSLDFAFAGVAFVGFAAFVFVAFVFAAFVFAAFVFAAFVFVAFVFAAFVFAAAFVAFVADFAFFAATCALADFPLFAAARGLDFVAFGFAIARQT
jgi:hypothetical protein